MTTVVLIYLLGFFSAYFLLKKIVRKYTYDFTKDDRKICLVFSLLSYLTLCACILVLIDKSYDNYFNQK